MIHVHNDQNVEMTREEAIQILRGGDEGIKTWNSNRHAFGQLPDLSGAPLRSANLRNVDLSHIVLAGACFNGAWLAAADFANADLRCRRSGGSVSRTDFGGAYAVGANFSNADLEGAYLGGANLCEANFHGATLAGAYLGGANLRNANLREADLSGTNLETATLIRTDLRNAILKGSRVYGTSAWELDLTGANQSDLIVSPKDAPTITVDNLEVAQFLILLLNNQKIREVIDTVSSKVVLILGRFTPPRKRILDALREELRGHNYCPILFDFDRPESRDFTETISTLAHLARFIVADITEAKSIPQELQAIVPTLSIPVVPILQGKTREYGMFRDFLKYPWVLPIKKYETLNALREFLTAEIVSSAEDKAKSLKDRRPDVRKP